MLVGMGIADSLTDELAALSEEQRHEVEREIGRREQAARIAAELGLDPHDVRLILKQLTLSPSERLRRGLTLGRVVRHVAL